MSSYGGYRSFCSRDVELDPFLKTSKGSDVKKKRRPVNYFPIDPKKHPVSLLYEYCSLQGIQPSFSFYEIPQKIGIEYGCIVTVENFLGEGCSFNKKNAKHQAAAHLLWKLTNPNYLGDMSLAPKRFVSETGVVCVHYEGGTGGVAGNSRRSCFKSPSSAAAGYTPPGPRVVKKVKWQDADAEPETDQQCDKEKKLRRLSVSDYNDLKNNDEPEDTESTESEDEAHTTARRGSPIPPFALLPVKNEEEDEASEPIVGAINDYLSERLLNTNISGPAKRTDVSSDDGEMTELPQNENEPLRKKKKFESFPGVSNIDKGAALRRKRK